MIFVTEGGRSRDKRETNLDHVLVFANRGDLNTIFPSRSY